MGIKLTTWKTERFILDYFEENKDGTTHEIRDYVNSRTTIGATNREVSVTLGRMAIRKQIKKIKKIIVKTPKAHYKISVWGRME